MLSNLTKYCQVGDIRLIKPIEPDMSYQLKVLPNRLCIATIRIINPDDDQYIDCDALIDTGAEFSVICESIFYRFKIDESKIIRDKYGIHSSTDNKEKIIAYPFHFKLPTNNWGTNYSEFGIRSFAHRIEYKAIIGMNLLDYYKFTYIGTSRQAFLDY